MWRLDVKSVLSVSVLGHLSARRQAGLTQAQMSDALGIPQRTITHWETGTRRPSQYQARLVIAALEKKQLIE